MVCPAWCEGKQCRVPILLQPSLGSPIPAAHCHPVQDQVQYLSDTSTCMTCHCFISEIYIILKHQFQEGFYHSVLFSFYYKYLAGKSILKVSIGHIVIQKTPSRSITRVSHQPQQVLMHTPVTPQNMGSETSIIT